jgi:hypothetical protein
MHFLTVALRLHGGPQFVIVAGDFHITIKHGCAASVYLAGPELRPFFARPGGPENLARYSILKSTRKSPFIGSSDSITAVVQLLSGTGLDTLPQSQAQARWPACRNLFAAESAEGRGKAQM